ncbi:hypothetical protein SOJ01_30900 [Pseudomonas aeruginosa]|uniref:hypothetical protein n=1 Tax=Pseudomonas aeruginosa TaxID=287 RepID=UPI001E34210A|nr:hypothetical protein [Pseudomonas aeruginosa]MDY1359575.1 hypothetical protein [Pseudomonas aeruginosa]
MRDGAVMLLGLELGGPAWGRIKEESVKLMRVWCASLLALVSSGVWAYGEINSLPGSQIVAAGDISQVMCPIGGNYDCLTWPSNLYELSRENLCFTADVMCGVSCEGFIAQKNGVNTLYILSGFSKLDSSDIKLYKCPSSF